MTIIKRSKAASGSDLVEAIEQLIPWLKDQDEQEACADLEKAASALKKETVGSDKHKDAVKAVVDAFEGDHELMAYTFQRDKGDDNWTEVEELSQASARVITLARRMI